MHALNHNKLHPRLRSLLAAAALLAPSAPHALAQSIINGGFEAGLTGFDGWTMTSQVGSSGGFLFQTGTTSPINGFLVPAPPEGMRAAMTDSTAGGSRVLFQDIAVPAPVTPGTMVQLKLFLYNHADVYHRPTPNHLDWAATGPQGMILNQQARIDLMLPSADPFSVAPGDVLQNIFETSASTPLMTGYDNILVDVTPALMARAGQTIRLRIAVVDNVNFFNVGVDDVVIIIPGPGTLAAAACGVVLLARRRRRDEV